MSFSSNNTYPKFKSLSLYNNRLEIISTANLQQLERLDLNNNKLDLINLENMTYLNYLDVSNNDILNINTSNSLNLKELSLSGNLISNLSLENNLILEFLACSGSQIEYLDLTANIALETLYCSGDRLKHLYLKNGTQQTVYLSSADSLSFICADSFEIQYLLTVLAENEVANCIVGSSCSYTSEGKPYQIYGKLEFSLDTICNDTNSITYPFPSLKLENNEGVNYALGNVDGEYQLNFGEGPLIIKPNLNSINYYEPIIDSISLSFPDTISPYQQDFCLIPTGIYNDLEILVFPFNGIRPGFNTEYKIIISNSGTTKLQPEHPFYFP